jgi:hypothetical protein
VVLQINFFICYIISSPSRYAKLKKSIKRLCRTCSISIFPSSATLTSRGRSRGSLHILSPGNGAPFTFSELNARAEIGPPNSHQGYACVPVFCQRLACSGYLRS